MKKKPTTTKLKKKLDSIFSQYIRLRDADEFGFAKCCTCGKSKPWKELQCGHWIHRNVLITRYDEYNCHAQCVGCNMFGGGKEHLHEMYIVDYHGKAIRDELLTRSKQIIKNFPYVEQIDYYTERVEEYKKIKP